MEYGQNFYVFEVLENYKDNLYFLTLTIPNVKGEELRYTYNKLAISFKYLNRYLSGDKKCDFLDLNFGYIGAVRSLETTFNNKDSYHPHYHVCLAFSKKLDLSRKYINDYSYSNKNGFRKFSDIEIIIQKLWFMIYNNIRITKDNYDSIKIGYSCSLDSMSNNDYMEIFKYMTKSTDESGEVMSYDTFKVLYYSSIYIHQIRGYGAFHNITDDDLDDEVDKMLFDIRFLLSNLDNSSNYLFDLSSLLSIGDVFTIISRHNIYQYLKSIK